MSRRKKLGGTYMWCPGCRNITPCAAIPLTWFGTDREQRVYRETHPDLNWFRRGRKCKECRHTFLTSETNEEFLEELCELREALSTIKRNAERYIAESDSAAASLKKLSDSLGVLRFLKIYRGEPVEPHTSE